VLSVRSHLIQDGFRVITYDRRGFGLSSKTSIGYDYDTFAKDLEILMTKLDLNDVTLVGHSMGSGEITRYLGTFGPNRVRSAVYISPIPPFILKTKDNQLGLERSILEEFKKSIILDRYAFITEFLKNFYNNDEIIGRPLSREKMRADFYLAASASPIAFLKCVDTWATDFREDLPKITIPCLIIQGDHDRILPIEITGKKMAKEIGAELKVVLGGSHGIPWTHSEVIYGAIKKFILRQKKSLPVFKKKDPSRPVSFH
jgi:non-heme chloroperoxidase